MTASSLACQRATAAVSACQARHRGRCGDSPSLRSRRSTLTGRQAHPELAADQLAVHLPRPQGELEPQSPRISPHDQLYRRRIWAPFSLGGLGGLPGTGLALNARGPPSRYLASYPNTVPRAIPNAAAATSGCSPASACFTVGIRSTSNLV